MNSIKEHLTEGYSQVDDFFQAHPQLARQRRSPNKAPTFTDNEVIALGLMQSYFRTADLKRVFLLVLANDARAFSAPISYQQWLHRLHALAPQVQALLAATGSQVYGTACVYLMDSKPIPVCAPIRHGRVRPLARRGRVLREIQQRVVFRLQIASHPRPERAHPECRADARQWDGSRRGLSLGLQCRGRRGARRFGLSR